MAGPPSRHLKHHFFFLTELEPKSRLSGLDFLCEVGLNFKPFFLTPAKGAGTYERAYTHEKRASYVRITFYAAE